jgi:RNA polymerase sigma factor (sigma-70 family)
MEAPDEIQTRALCVQGMEPSRPPNPFSLLYDEHLDFVCALVRRVGVRKDDVPDVAQEVFATLAGRMEKGLDTSAPLRSYVRATAVSRALNWKKLARQREQPHAEAGAVEALMDARVSEEPMERPISVNDCVDAVLERLPQEQRSLLVMSDIEEMPKGEIAGVLGISMDAMYSRLYRAREAFALAWGERRATGAAAFAPFALWSAASLLANDRAIPHASPELRAEVWRRLVASGLTIAGAGAAAGAGAGAVAGGAAGGAVVKAGILMTAKQLVLGVVVSGLAGAGIYAALASADEQPQAKPVPVSIRSEAPGRGGPSPSAAALVSTAPVPLSGTAPGLASAAPALSALLSGSAATSADANERHLLDGAQEAIGRGDWAGARAALARVHTARNATERESLLGIVRAYEQDGGAR